MKKKFFTLLAAAAFLVGTAVPALAAVPYTAPTGMLGANAKGLVDGQNRGLYHIAVHTPGVIPSASTLDGVLRVNSSTGVVTIASALPSTLSETLWCISIDTEAQGKNPSFSFLNKAYGDNLRAENTAVTSLVLDGPLSDWNFSKVYGPSVDLDQARPLYSYINSSQAIVLVQGSTPTRVKTIIANVADIEDAVLNDLSSVQTPSGGSEVLLYFSVVEAAPIVLTHTQFNTKLGADPGATGQKLTFDPDVSGNLFSENVLIAEAGTGSAYDRYLRLKNADGKYLRVDTAVVNEAGSYFLDFNFETRINTGWFANQYLFRFVYFPTHDSLVINAKGVLQPSKTLEAAGTVCFSDIALMSVAGASNANEGKIESDDVFDDFGNPVDLDDFTYVILQDLGAEKIVTIGELPAQTRISLGLGGCAAASNKTTKEGLFTIKNKDGKYLQVPIYTDPTPEARWVTVEKNVDVNQMPSFQWVVERNRKNDPDSTSTIKITNREYKGVSVATALQLLKDAESTIAGTKVAANAAGFTEVPTAQREDKYLGYKYVSQDEAKISTYTFNYLHEFTNDRYLSVKNAQDDSKLYVETDPDAFALKSLIDPIEEYGYQPPSWDDKGYATKLYRTKYTLTVKEGGKIWNTNKTVYKDEEDRYAVTASTTPSVVFAEFYLKTNNTTKEDGRNFYALVDVASKQPSEPFIKGGVDDNNVYLKAQNFKEIRTSAFAVEKNENPLYRRFNRTVDGIENGATSFYDDVDKPVKLRFHRLHNENEFLYEDSSSVYSKTKGINFLGYKHTSDFGDKVDKDSLERRTTFYVDTAFVNRPASTSVDFDTPKPQYLLAVGVKIYSDTIMPSGECEPEIVAEGYTRGRYLINATDSAAVNSKYIWDTKWERLAFVDAIHKGDTLYVLNGQKYDNPIQDFQDLISDDDVTKINLNENTHKDVVFSFRLIEDEKKNAYKDQKQSFLIESETKDRGTDPMIAPIYGGWVKLQNGVPVISRGAYDNAITEAERFNTKSAANVDPAATPNEDINVTAVKVVAGNGNVTILNAAGKTVTISNILGQTVANTTISSDNVTIAAPKGIVVVAVQGEDAVKAIVK